MNHKDYTNKIKRNDALNALATNYKMSVKESYAYWTMHYLDI